MSLRLLASVIVCSAGFGLLVPISVKGQGKAEHTAVEQTFEPSPPNSDGSLATIHYQPSKLEKPYFDRLAPDEITTGSLTSDYEISTRNKKYVGWFGIVRKIDEDLRKSRTLLTVEHKYFDGLTDSHCQCVSFNGSGDFVVELQGANLRIPPLSLVKVYGTVTRSEPESLPKIKAEFVRAWHWGTFSFLSAYGTQHGNAEWKKQNSIPVDQIYEAWIHPCLHYYEERLGKRPDTEEIIKRLIASAEAKTPAATVTMERFARLLSVGWPWSKEESFRQMHEDSEIEMLLKEPGALQAAVKLLVQALQENDSRISTAAATRIGGLDSTGEAVPALAQLLANKNLEVQIRAVDALGSRYGKKAAPSVGGLIQCLTQSNSQLKYSAIMTLGKIGSNAKLAIPALKKTSFDGEAYIRIARAIAIWKIDRQPEDVLPILIKDLELESPAQLSTTVEQLKQMGPWAAPAVPALIKVLEGNAGDSRSAVIKSLGEIGPSASQAIPILVKILTNDTETFYQATAAEALGAIHDRQAIPHLIKACENPDDYVQHQVLNALESFGHEAKSAVPAVIKLIKNQSDRDWIAADALGTIDADGVGRSILVEALESSRPNLKRFAASGLQKMGTKAAESGPALLPLLKDSEAGVRIAAAGAYYAVSGKLDEAVRVLRAELRNSDFPEAMWAAEELTAIGAPAKAAVPELIEKLGSETQYVTSSVAEALGKIGPDAKAAVPALVDLLANSDDAYIRAHVALALWKIDQSEKSQSVIQDILVNSNNSMAVSTAAEAAGEFGGPEATWSPLLRPLLKDSDRFVRQAAEKALKKIEGK